MQENILKEIRNSKVEWKKISELFKVKNGYTPSKAKEEFWENGELPWFRIEDIRINGRELSDAIQHVTTLGIKGKLFPANSLIMSTTATIGEHALVKVPHLTNQQITNFSLSEEFKDKINIKFAFYCFFDFGKWCVKNANKSGTLSIIGLEKLASYEIPLPSLELQNKIVEILDKFTLLLSELKKENELRKKQYKFYREKLLSFGDEVEWKELGELCEIIRGNRVTKKDLLKEGKYPVVSGGTGFMGFLNEFNREKNTITIAQYGTAGFVKWQEQDFWANDVCYSVKPKLNFLLNRYLYFFLINKQEFLYSISNRTAIPYSIERNKILKIKIPLPSLEKQQEIVSILDKFETLTNSLTEGLPKEIELRQKQYEYYRNLLLSFAE